MSGSIVEKVAQSIAEANPKAGQAFDAQGQQPTAVRAQNLITMGYIVDGAQGNADQTGCLVTVYLEGMGRCGPPWEYWDDGSAVSIAAASRLQEGTEKYGPFAGYFETINPGCAAMYAD